MVGRVRLLLWVLLLGLLVGLVGVVSAQSEIMITILEDANVRAAPDVAAARIGPARAQIEYTGTGRTEDLTWIQIDYDGRPGWVSRNLVAISSDPTLLPVVGAESAEPESAVVEPVEEAEAPPPVDPGATADSNAAPVTVTTLSEANLRATPSLTGRIVSGLGPGIQLPATARLGAGENFWLRLDFRGDEVWIAGWIVSVEGDLASLPLLVEPIDRANAIEQLRTGLDKTRAVLEQIAPIWYGLISGDTVFCSTQPAMPLPVAFDVGEETDIQAALNALNAGIEDTRAAIQQWRDECALDRELIPPDEVDRGVTAVNNADGRLDAAETLINVLTP